MEKNTLNTNPGGNLSESKCQSRYANEKMEKTGGNNGGNDLIFSNSQVVLD